jgi:hypothetical protein
MLLGVNINMCRPYVWAFMLACNPPGGLFDDQLLGSPRHGDGLFFS